MLDYLEKLFAADNIDAIWALHVAHMARYGFDRLLYGYTRFLTADSLGAPDDRLLLSNHHPDYMKAFLDGGLFEHAPLVRWAVAHAGVRSWSEVAEEVRAGTLGPEALKVLALNRAYGVLAGVSISFLNRVSLMRAGIGLCAAPGIGQQEVDAIWARQGREILLANQCMHLRIASLPFYALRGRLTRRQREVLEAVGEGKTVVEIARRLGLTQATVEKHLRLARMALGVETTAQAVLKATLHHRIYLAGPPGHQAK